MNYSLSWGWVFAIYRRAVRHYKWSNDVAGRTYRVSSELSSSVLSMLGQVLQACFAKQGSVYLGEVVDIHPERVTVRMWGNGNPTETCQSPVHHSTSIQHHSCPPVQPGDSVLFDNGYPEGQYHGRQVYVVEYYRHNVTLMFRQGDLDRRVQVGDLVWRI